MMKRYASVVILCSLIPLWVGCASTTPSKFYTLSATAEPGGAKAGYSVAVGPVAGPAAVDRPQMVLRVGPNEVAIDEFNRWASPLQNDIARVVAENLVKSLGTPLVDVYPHSTAFSPAFRVGIDVVRFESEPGKRASLDAVWTVRAAKEGRTRSGRTTASEPVADGSSAAMVAAHSRALTRLSNEVAEAIRALEKGE